MQIYQNPSRADWPKITARPTLDTHALESSVRAILDDVQREGDEAVRRYTERFDQVQLPTLQVPAEAFAKAEAQLDPALKEAIQAAHANITQFHAAQEEPLRHVETMPGVLCWRKSVGIERVGLYVPGGTAPLFSSVLMLGVPAKIAGCKEVVLCTPPSHQGSVHPAMLYAAGLIGIDKVFSIGGVQAVGAMAYGTASVPNVHKIFGPGNQYVTAAKQQVMREGIAIDMPAGPSEVLVFADHSADPVFVAADLLSQAEHGVDSQVVLVSTDEQLPARVQSALDEQLQALPRAEITRKALDNSAAIVVADRQEALDLINEYAPEHLILSIEDAEALAEGIINAGSVFLGHYTPESVGDYASGTNHTLPTHGFAKAYSGVSLDSFVKKITFQRLSPEGLQRLGPHVEVMAEAEALRAHKLAVSLRLQKLQQNG